MDALPLLRRAPLFTEAASSELAKLATGCDVRLYNRGDHVVHAGSPQSAMIFLSDGQLLLYRRNKQRKLRVMLGVLHAPSFFGDAEWGARCAWLEDVRAETDCTLVMMDNGAVERFLQRNPKVLFTVYRDACVRHMMANQSVQCLALYDVRTRLLRVLLDFVNTAGWVHQDRGFTGKSAVRVADLAGAVGATERTVARALSELRTDGTLASDDDTGGFVINGLAQVKRDMPDHFLGLSSAVAAVALPVAAELDLDGE